MKTYSVTVDTTTNSCSCFVVNAKADYAVHSDYKENSFGIVLEADNEKSAIASAYNYFRSYIMKSAEKKCEKVFGLLMKEFKNV